MAGSLGGEAYSEIKPVIVRTVLLGMVARGEGRHLMAIDPIAHIPSLASLI